MKDIYVRRAKCGECTGDFWVRNDEYAPEYCPHCGSDEIWTMSSDFKFKIAYPDAATR